MSRKACEQQQRVSQAAADTGSPNLDRQRPKELGMWISAEAADGRVRIWHQQHESMHHQPAAGGVMMLEMFSWCNMGHLKPVNYWLNFTVYQRLQSINQGFSVSEKDKHFVLHCGSVLIKFLQSLCFCTSGCFHALITVCTLLYMASVRS